MFISHKSNVIQQVSETEWNCRRKTKGIDKPEYWAWVDSVTTVSGDPPDEKISVDYSGETGYTIVECADENVEERLKQLDSYYSHTIDTGTVYNIKYYASKRDSEIVDVPAHTIPAHSDEDGNDVAEEDVATTYVQTHFIGDDTAKDARILADEWTRIRTERDRLLANSDWTQGADSPLTSAKKTEWATYRTKLRTLPEDQKAKKTYADITWPSQPS